MYVRPARGTCGTCHASVAACCLQRLRQHSCTPIAMRMQRNEERACMQCTDVCRCSLLLAQMMHEDPDKRRLISVLFYHSI